MPTPSDIFPSSYENLFTYFVGARGEHVLHVRALVTAGFIVEQTDGNESRSIVYNPADGSIVGVIVGAPIGEIEQTS
jgi:hypothetical protein